MNKKYAKRTNFIYITFIFLFIVVFSKIFYLQVFKSQFLKSKAKRQHYSLIKLKGKRGDILDCQKRILATGINYYSIFADPSRISNKPQVSKILSKELKLSRSFLSSRLAKKKKFVWIKRKISLQEKENLKALNLKGIGFIREEKRFYPQDNLLSSVLGLVDIDNRGLEGLEAFYDNYLQGKDGWSRVLQDSTSRKIILSTQVVTPQEGADIVLTIDAQIQYLAEKYIKQVVKEYDAKSGSVVVMVASKGDILALANYPDFNPNRVGIILPGSIRNSAVADMFEPGSVFKVATLLASIDKGMFSDDDKFFCENGSYKIPGTILHDWKPYGELSYKEVFMKSSNIGVAKIAAAIGSEEFLKYLKLLGFGQKTGIDLPAETKGSLKPLRQWSRTSIYIIPIGQEVAVNLLQLARAFAVVANGGYLVKPYIVKDVCSQGYCKSIDAKRKRILSKATADRAKNILEEVVKNGTGKRAYIKGRAIGGKTGTAQKYDPKIKKYSKNKYRATFVGFVADTKPPLVIAVTVDEPKKSHFGGVVAAPVFKKIAQGVIKYTESSKNNENLSKK